MVDFQMSKIADKKVTAIGFEASDGMRRVFVLKRDGIEEGVNDLDKNIEVIFYEKDQEKKLIERCLRIGEKISSTDYIQWRWI